MFFLIFGLFFLMSVILAQIFSNFQRIGATEASRVNHVRSYALTQAFYKLAEIHGASVPSSFSSTLPSLDSHLEEGEDDEGKDSKREERKQAKGSSSSRIVVASAPTSTIASPQAQELPLPTGVSSSSLITSSPSSVITSSSSGITSVSVQNESPPRRRQRQPLHSASTTTTTTMMIDRSLCMRLLQELEAYHVVPPQMKMPHLSEHFFQHYWDMDGRGAMSLDRFLNLCDAMAVYATQEHPSRGSLSSPSSGDLSIRHRRRGCCSIITCAKMTPYPFMAYHHHHLCTTIDGSFQGDSSCRECLV
jgi:hypothetical protein